MPQATHDLDRQRARQLRLILSMYVHSLPWVVVGLGGVAAVGFFEALVA